ncbi:hypothetical protein [Pyramidobacter piscolens]|uniref:hypothetical protein n=1 Tax=Pyramidobacter piscolens TaxID=638849 RepID=UPI002AB1F38B|nr:hypothetical protein [Pyramidobacter piscolens]
MNDEISRRPRMPDREEYYQPRRRAPLFLRVLAQLSVMVIFLAAGYYGADLFLKMLDRKNVLKQENIVSNTEDLQRLLAAGDWNDSVVGPRKELVVYPLGRDGMVKAGMKVLSEVQEDEIIQAVNAVFRESSESWANVIEAKHVYRDGIAVYLDLPQGFAAGLGKMSEERALLMLTGIVRTVVENFLPVKQVYFLQEGRWVQNVGSIHLSDPWGLENANG